MRKRIFSRLMAMFMAVALLSTSALAYVAIDQDYINGLNEKVQSDDLGNQYVSMAADEYELKENIETQYTLKFDDTKGKTSLELNGFTIDHGGKAGSVIHVGEGADVTIKDSSEEGTGTITGGTGILVQHGNREGGGIFIEEGAATRFEMDGGNVTENIAHDGGGIRIRRDGTCVIKNANISKNTASSGGGGMYWDLGEGTVTIENSTISHNTADYGGGVYSGGASGTVTIKNCHIDYNSAEKCGGFTNNYGKYPTIQGGTFIGNISKNIGDTFLHDVFWTNLDDNVLVCGNSTYGDPHDFTDATCTEDSVCSRCGEHGTEKAHGHQHTELRGAKDPSCEEPGYTGDTWCTDCNTMIKTGTDIEANGHTPGAPVEENRVEAQPGVPGSYDLVVRCTVCNEIISSTPGSIPALPMPIDFGDSFMGGTGTDTTISDEETPLAGILTLADLLNALYEHEEIEAVELPEDFQWADHVCAQAIYWGLSENLVVDTEDDPLDPDELLTVALLREVLANFVEYKGADLAVIVDGEDDELVLDLGERLTAFYARLEEAPAKKAA